MKNNFIIVIILTVTLFVACHKSGITKTSGTSNAVSESKNTTPVKDVIKDAIIDPETDMTNIGTAYTIDSAKINADILSVFVSYAGCCKENSFELYSNGMYAKSLPPQLSLCLRHTMKGEPCRTLVTRELKFNVLKLKYPGKNTVILKLGDKRVTYATKPI